MGDAYTKEAARLYPKSREQARKRDTDFDLVERIHESETSFLKQPPEPSHTFAVTLEPDDFTEEKYLLYENYQQVVHRESPASISRDGFTRFLCSSPLKRETLTTPDGGERQLGSFHQCYRLDGQLVAIGVLDLLPECVSAVYFIYHESIQKFSPGKLGALREIALAIEGGYRWWYPGFYIHTCPKMKYKTEFIPQQILDPDTLEWADLTREVLNKFDSHGYLRLGGNETPPIEETPSLEADGSEDDSSEDKVGSAMGEVSLFDSNMPGIPSVQIMDSVDMDHIAVRLYRTDYYNAGELFEWDHERVEDRYSTKHMVAELVAALGPDLVNHLCLDFKKA
ncbi:hypothetical protein M426DRAFT_10643 [Hypoxylon sp. CI-4A]|nr:hypothetical protein M426DRAFT_10643 [Hypoxylon sp. CI-4A]